MSSINTMLNAQVIGLGAAGNKATINLVQKEAISIEDVMLVNSTAKDIPPAYQMGNRAVIIGDQIGGCGQEREKGKEVCVQALQIGRLNLDAFVKPTTDLVVVIASTEGGTGSGAAVVVSQYLSEVLKMNVVLFAITGFEQEPIVPRAIWNTIDFFKDVRSSYHVEILRNKNFLQDCRGNYLKAEAACNDEIVKRFRILTGQLMIAAEQNIDSRDLTKLATEPGWGNIEYREIDEKIKNIAQFNDIIDDMIDETKSMDPAKPSQKRMGVIVNLSQKELDAIDYSFGEIVGRYGTPYEMYKHIQSNEGINHFIAFISTGMHLPLEEFEALYEKYEQATSEVESSSDAFFDKISQMNQGTDQFNMKENAMTEEKVAAAKTDFFSQFGVAPAPEKTPAAHTNDEPTQSIPSARDMGEY